MRKLMLVAFVLGVAAVVMHALIIFVLPLAEDVRLAITNGLMVLYGFTAAGVLIYAALQAKKISRRVGIAWLLVGIATAMYATGDLIWGYIEVVLRENTSPSLADAAYLSFYIYFIAGIFILPTRMLKPDERIRLVLDMGIVAVSSILLFWSMLFGPILLRGAPNPFELFVTFAYPSLDMVLLLGVVAIMLRSGHLQSSHLLLALSALVMVVADTIFNLQILNDSYVSGSPVDLLYVAQYALAAWAGVQLIATVRCWPEEISNPFEDHTPINPLKRMPRRITFLLPFLWIGMAFCLLVYEHFVELVQPERSTFNFVAVGLACIIVLVLLRQYIQLQETTRLSTNLTLLLDSSRMLALPVHAHDAARVVLKQLSTVLAFERAAIALPKDDGTIQVSTATQADGMLVVQPYRSLPSTHMLWRVLDLQKMAWSDSPTSHAMEARDAVYYMLGASSYTGPMLSWMISPLVVNDLTIGLVAVSRSEPYRYTSEHASLFMAYSMQAAAAIENARLRRHETQAAAAAERSRLARELHDSVSQALFGVTLGIQTAQVILDSESPAREPLSYSLNLANGALAEMKALIFELRPETLATEGLVQALRKQTDALCKRHQIDARIDAPINEPAISLDAKEALYRITLEAVQNTIRHAQASRVDILLTQSGNTIVLMVRDDGRGFDATATYSGHLGLVSMRERSEQLGGAFEVTSEIGRGTCVRVSVPMIEAGDADSAGPVSLSSRR